jgi:hypothetical protein
MNQETQGATPTPQATAAVVPAAPPSKAPETITDFDKQLEFLYKVHEDSQNLIRFLDAKAAFAVAILAAMVNKVLSSLGLYFPWSAQPYWRQILVLAFGFTALIAALLVALILFPITNPALNARLIPAANEPTFFLTRLDPKKWLRFFFRGPHFSRLAQDHSDYLNQVKTLSNTTLLQVISGEVLKVSYIRQIKTDRLRAITIVLTTCAIIFALLMGTDAKFQPPTKPTLVQIQGPVMMNLPPTNVPAQGSNPVASPNSSAPGSGSAGTPSPNSPSKDTPTDSTKH